MSRSETHWNWESYLSHDIKTIHTIIGTDIQEPTGALQLCVGQQVGCEATAHSMYLVHEDPETKAAIIVDVTNALQRHYLHDCCPCMNVACFKVSGRII